MTSQSYEISRDRTVGVQWVTDSGSWISRTFFRMRHHDSVEYSERGGVDAILLLLARRWEGVLRTDRGIPLRKYAEDSATRGVESSKIRLSSFKHHRNIEYLH